MRQLEEQEIKKRLVNLLVDFASYCDEHDLHYHLTGGTLLGAARHQGFIPWDDDIDVSMPRPDYDRFIQLKKEDKATNILCIENENADYPFLKIVDQQTVVKQDNLALNKALGLWIDVFPHDGWAQNERRAFKSLLWLRIWKSILPYTKAQVGCGTTKLRMILKIPVILFAKCIGSCNIVRAMDKLARKYSYDDSEWIGNFVWASYGLRERVPKDWYSQSLKLQFEGKSFWVPYKWEEYLTSIYGNYMKLPPEEKRVTHNMVAYVKE